MRIIGGDVHMRGWRGSAIVVAVLACLAPTALTASTSAASSPPRASSTHRIEATATDATSSPPAAFVAVTPVRILDTRPAPAGPVGLTTPAKLGPGARLDLRLAGDGLIVPAAATGVLINVTIDEDATLPSYLTIWPMGEPQPFTSANNSYPGLIQSNSLVAKLGNGGISVFNQRGSINVVIDLVGYVMPLSAIDLPGALLQSGAGAPTTAVGDDGDFYLDTTNHILYGPKVGGSWPAPGITLGGGAAGPSGPAGATGPTGAAGAAGSKVLTGTTAPASGLGSVGDMYIDTALGTLYIKTGPTTWTTQGAGGLKGPQGAAGAAGPIEAALSTYNDAPVLTGSNTIPFTVGDVTAGATPAAITHSTVTNTDTFTVTTGTYRVSYRMSGSLGIGGGGTIRVTLDGVGVGSTNQMVGGLFALGLSTSDTLLIKVTGATGALRLSLPSSLSLSIGSASIEIDKIA